MLALWAFPQPIVPLTFELHEELAKEHNGADVWDYRRVSTVTVEADSRGAASVEDVLPKDLDWIKPSLVSDCQFLGDTDTTAQVHPYKFTTTILKLAQEAGVELVEGKALKIIADKGRISGVSYSLSDGTTSTISADRIICTLGPWTKKLLPTCPISGTKAHSITVEPTSQVSPYAVFAEVRMDRSRYSAPEIYGRKDEIYVCGEGSHDPLPETTNDVIATDSRCEDLFKSSGLISSEIACGKITRKQACFLPVVEIPSTTGPFIGQTNAKNLYIASGHSCWGINNAPGTGKVMAEIVLDGKAKSADVSSLSPTRFFKVDLNKF